MATSGDFLLATTGDFFMATDMGSVPLLRPVGQTAQEMLEGLA